MLQSANKQVSEQEQKMRMATEQLQVSYSSLNRLLNHVGIKRSVATRTGGRNSTAGRK